ncbi:hypothetical protein JK358_07170 [Nocardia sp. 2]|uniref:TY-Chap N-terminal domain-containing protein n=1 Tax=Nocardia acididurans TaxID=2802282 RepID=A0ABS1M0W4_9NOCA|nr:hypothetical protein [Nocardia acididurans]MBL1074174.1 hypothetical protein [Nocardia acididurans]
MGVEGWDVLLNCMPFFLEEDEEADEDSGLGWNPRFIQVRDESTGRPVHFAQQGNDIEVVIAVPDDAADAEQLLSVLQAQPDGFWEPCPLHKEADLDAPDPHWQAVQRVRKRPELAREWNTGWRRGSAIDYRRQVAASVVEVLRKGLGARPERLRFTSWSLDAPGSGTFGLAADRPSERYAPADCDDWADFEARLAWALTTLPWDGVINLSTPHPGPDPCFVQFLHGRRLYNEASGWDVAGIGAAEFDRRMGDLGWSFAPHSAPGGAALIWEGPVARAGYKPNLQGAPHRTVTTFREVFTVRHPQDLVFRAFRNGRRRDPELRYLDLELGIPRDVR